MGLQASAPINFHLTQLTVTDQNTGWTKTYSLDGTGTEADCNLAETLCTYAWNFNQFSLVNNVVAGSYFVNGMSQITITSSDGTKVTSQPFYLSVPQTVNGGAGINFAPQNSNHDGS